MYKQPNQIHNQFQLCWNVLKMHNRLKFDWQLCLPYRAWSTITKSRDTRTCVRTLLALQTWPGTLCAVQNLNLTLKKKKKRIIHTCKNALKYYGKVKSSELHAIYLLWVKLLIYRWDKYAWCNICPTLDFEIYITFRYHYWRIQR